MINPAEGNWKNLRNRFLRRILIPIAGTVVIAPYVLGLLLNLPPDQLKRALLFVAPPLVLLNGILQQFVVSGWECRRALQVNPEDPPGSRLERLLALPRRLEVMCVIPAHTVGGVLYAFICCVAFDRPFVLVPLVGLVTLGLALLVGIPVSLTFQNDLLPYVLTEHARSRVARPNHSGFTWQRQSWYLPYTFFVLLLVLGVWGGITVSAKLDEAKDQLVQQLTANGGAQFVDLARDNTSLILSSIVPPLTLLGGVLLAYFMVSGWLIGQQERRAAKAIEDSLLSLTAGAPKSPQWLGTTEVGDVAFAVAAMSRDMEQIFTQLRAIAAGDLSVKLEGESGLITAFRSSQTGLVQLSQQMQVLSRGDTVSNVDLSGDLGKVFSQLSAAMGATIAQAKTIARGDLRNDMQMSGELGSAIHQMTSNLRVMVGQTQQVSDRIGEIVVSLRSATAQLSTATAEQVSALAETANTMTEMSQTSAASADRCAELIRQGDAASTVVEDGKGGAKDASRAMEAIATSLGKVAGDSGLLADKVRQVDLIIESVGFLADQSSTLAINAAIEASRAGDAGRGFAAVAREMRTLASDSRKATGQIRDILQEIRQCTTQVDASVAAGASTVEEGVRFVVRLAEVIGQLGVTIHDAVGLMRQVEGAARQHQAGVVQVTSALRSMQGASESIRDGARMLSGMSEKAHEMSATLKASTDAYHLPTPSNGANGTTAAATTAKAPVSA
jgi:methyl-accepting chemotaxis protein